MPTVFIPPLLRPLANGAVSVELSGNTVAELVDALEDQFPGMKPKLCNDGEVRPELSVSIDDEIAHSGLAQEVSAGAEVHFLPAIGGG